MSLRICSIIASGDADFFCLDHDGCAVAITAADISALVSLHFL